MEKHSNNLKYFLKMMIKANCMTQTEFCKELKIHRSLLYQYYNDDVRPSVAMCLKISDLLECSPKEVFEQIRPRKKYYGKHVYDL